MRQIPPYTPGLAAKTSLPLSKEIEVVYNASNPPMVPIMKTIMVLFFFSLAAAPVLHAAPPATPASSAKAGKKDPQVFDFEGDVIESEFLRPNSALVETVKKRAGLSLVRIKTSFLDKILATVDEL